MITFLGLSAALDVTYLVDAVRVGTIHRPHQTVALPGGKALNAARAAHTLGGSARVIVPIGGYTGQRVRASLDAFGVPSSAIECAAETRLCISVFDGDDDGASPTEFYEPAPAIAGTTWLAVQDEVRRIESGWLAVCGSIPDSCIPALVHALKDAAARGVTIVLDTHGWALGRLLAERSAALVKINRSEAETLVGSGTTEILARRLHERFEVSAIVTDGPDGAVGVFAEQSWQAAAAAAGRYAVGSGDCFLAGLLVAFDRRPDVLPGALRLATATAVTNMITPGAALFDLDDVERIAEGVRVQRLS